MKHVPINKIQGNERNPRKVDAEKFRKLVNSLRDFPDMLEKRPLIVADGVILGGNMRYKAALELGLKTVPVIDASDWTEDQRQQFIIKDNLNFGEWDWDILANEWEVTDLQDWGMPIPYTDDDFTEMDNPNNEETENIIATELDRESNYVVLKFERDIDWIQAKTLLGLNTETALRSNGKPWSQGIGRVLNGPEAIKKLSNAY